MEVHEIIERKNELEAELEDLRREYLRIVEPCENRGCSFYRENGNHCSWTHWVTTCPDYMTAE